jgi:hypothetical protein
MRELRLAAARKRQHGVQIMSFEQLAARLASGLSRPVDDEVLRATIQANLPNIALGELNSLKSLPGMVGALVDTLRKAWRAGVDLQARAGEHPRIASIASLEERNLAALPPAMMRPVDLVATGLQRLRIWRATPAGWMRGSRSYLARSKRWPVKIRPASD